MSPNTEDTLATIGAIGFLALLIGGAIWAERIDKRDSCAQRWAKSGLHSEWSPSGGCRVQTRDGRWIPEAPR